LAEALTPVKHYAYTPPLFSVFNADEERETERDARDEAVLVGRKHGPEGFFENLDPCSWISEVRELKRGPRASHAEAPSPPQLPGEPDADTALALFLSGLRGTSGADFRGDGDDRHRDGSLSHPDGAFHTGMGGAPIGVPGYPIWIGVFSS